MCCWTEFEKFRLLRKAKASRLHFAAGCGTMRVVSLEKGLACDYFYSLAFGDAFQFSGSLPVAIERLSYPFLFRIRKSLMKVLR